MNKSIVLNFDVEIAFLSFLFFCSAPLNLFGFSWESLTSLTRLLLVKKGFEEMITRSSIKCHKICHFFCDARKKISKLIMEVLEFNNVAFFPCSQSKHYWIYWKYAQQTFKCTIEGKLNFSASKLSFRMGCSKLWGKGCLNLHKKYPLPLAFE